MAVERQPNSHSHANADIDPHADGHARANRDRAGDPAGLAYLVFADCAHLHTLADEYNNSVICNW